ncbi:MAG: peptidoglycan DD-metalloendopeptidase family protein [Rhodospirillales bacterium]|nr:peptidoglycan DD-metalloendopeptidase family protein [Rhodospirillales bacterium]
MRIRNIFSLSSQLVAAVLFGSVLTGVPSGQALAQGKDPEMAIKKFDRNGDGKVSRKEWKRDPATFEEIDTDGDGFLTVEEFKARFSSGEKSAKKESRRKKSGGDGKDGGNIISKDDLAPVTFKGFKRKPDSRAQQIELGLLETNLIPVYPDDVYCPKIDHIFGEPWRGPVPNRWHSGGDIPSSWDDPIHAMADGVVIAKFDSGFRGIQVILQHAPEDTGLDVWVYTLYSHFRTMPEVAIGQRVRMGEYLGPNGKTGVPGKKREPHLHLTIMFAATPKYALLVNEKGSLMIPLDGYFAGPLALMRRKMPIDTHSMRALREQERRVIIAYKKESGAIVPPDAKIIWPFTCR